MSAVSQADSPESNPNSPLPVTALLVQYTNNKLIGQKLEWFSQKIGFDQLSWFLTKRFEPHWSETNKYSPKALRMY